MDIDLTTEIRRRRYYDDDPFFDEGNEQRDSKFTVIAAQATPILNPITNTPEQEEEFNSNSNCHDFYCNIQSCRCSFRTAAEYASHYAVQHRHRCETCSAVLPNIRLLELHIQERHDSYFAAMAARKPSYKCIVQSCSTTFWTKQERAVHLQTIHLFPKHFCYDMQKRTRSQTLQKNRSGQKKKKKKKKKKKARINDEDLVQLMSKTTISFGRHRHNARHRTDHHWSKNNTRRKNTIGTATASDAVGSTFGDSNGLYGCAGKTAGDVPTLNRRQRRALARAQQNINQNSTAVSFSQ